MDSEDKQAWGRKPGLQGVGWGRGRHCEPPHPWLAALSRLLASQAVVPPGGSAGCERRVQGDNRPAGKQAGAGLPRTGPSILQPGSLFG